MKFDLEDGKEYRISWKDSQNYPGWQTYITTERIVNSEEPVNTTRGVYLESKSDSEYIAIAHTNDVRGKNHMNILKILRTTVVEIEGLTSGPACYTSKELTRSRLKAYASISVIAIMIIAAVLIVLFSPKFEEGQFVKGKYGTKCYIVGSENKNIKYPIYFKTLDDCQKTL